MGIEHFLTEQTIEGFAFPDGEIPLEATEPISMAQLDALVRTLVQARQVAIMLATEGAEDPWNPPASVALIDFTGVTLVTSQSAKVTEAQTGKVRKALQSAGTDLVADALAAFEDMGHPATDPNPTEVGPKGSDHSTVPGGLDDEPSANDFEAYANGEDPGAIVIDFPTRRD